MGVRNLTRVTRDIEGSESVIASEKLLSGENKTTAWNAFSDSTGQFHVGHWASGPCKIKVSYTENEYCVLIQGSAILSDETGNSETFAPGEPFVIEAGFEGTWESIGDVVKVYVIFEAAS